MRTFLWETPVLIIYRWGEGVNLTAQMLVVNQGDKQSFSFKITLKSTSDAVCERIEDTLHPWCDYFSTNCCSPAMLQACREERNFRNLYKPMLSIISYEHFILNVTLLSSLNRDIMEHLYCGSLFKRLLSLLYQSYSYGSEGGWMWKSNVGGSAITRHVILKKSVSQKTFKSVDTYRIGNNLVYKHFECTIISWILLWFHISVD